MPISNEQHVFLELDSSLGISPPTAVLIAVVGRIHKNGVQPVLSEITPERELKSLIFPSLSFILAI